VSVVASSLVAAFISTPAGGLNASLGGSASASLSLG
jgi:hypothetical protein